MIIEFLNKVELQGYVGTAKVTSVGDTRLVRFSLCTQHSHGDRDGRMAIDITWHNCTAWDNKSFDITKIQKGAAVHLTGRLRTQRYTAADGSERTLYEVIAGSIEILEQ